MFHPRSFINQIDMRLLLLLSIIVDIWLSFQRHPIWMRLQLFVHCFEWRPLRTQINAFIIFILLTQSFRGTWLTRQQPNISIILISSPSSCLKFLIQLHPSNVMKVRLVVILKVLTCLRLYSRISSVVLLTIFSWPIFFDLFYRSHRISSHRGKHIFHINVSLWPPFQILNIWRVLFPR